jgi:hypothetical protein
MGHLRFRRLCRALLIYTAVIVLIEAFIAVIGAFHAPSPHSLNGQSGIRFTHLFLLAGFLAAIVANVFGVSLSNANESRALLWTLPYPRERVALAYVALDVTFIFAAFVEAFLVFGVVPMLVQHVPFTTSADMWPVLAAALGAPLMWYALLQLATHRAESGLTYVAMAVFPFALMFVVLVQLPLPPATHDAVFALNIFNPLAYLPTSFGERHHSAIAVFGDAPLLRALFTWTFAGLATAAATILWARAEA